MVNDKTIESTFLRQSIHLYQQFFFSDLNPYVSFTYHSQLFDSLEIIIFPTVLKVFSSLEQERGDAAGPGTIGFIIISRSSFPFYPIGS
jgi:hypothetical protein